MPSPRKRGLFALIYLAILQVCLGREVVTFNFGWKHRKGLTTTAGPDDEPPQDATVGLNPPEVDPKYADGDWTNVQLPHDGLIGTKPSQKACPGGCSGNSFLPRAPLWYRKNFTLPKEWESDVVWLQFEGSFRNTTVWINGKKHMNHVCGYTPFQLKLDNIVEFGTQNTIAVFVDPDNGDVGGPARGSGWWYEGGGLYRDVKLMHMHNVHIAQDGFFAYSKMHFDPQNGTVLFADLFLNTSIVNEGTETQDFCMSYVMEPPSGNTVSPLTDVQRQTIEPGQELMISKSVQVFSPTMWTSAHPSLQRIHAIVTDCMTANTQDQVSINHGFRSLKYDANQGFFLNEKHFKVCGFCDHDSFAVVGAAVPERISLFKAQASRSIGGNGRRMSHNPPDPSLLEIYGRLGMVVIDENCLFDDNPQYVENMATLVKRDRNHPSVILWSFCNENGCEGEHEKGGPKFQAVAETYDGTRPTLANMFTFNDLLSNTIDVQGFSHQNRETLEECHSSLPDKPIFMSECCSCNTMRGEDIGCETTKDNPHYACNQISFNARCLDRSVNASDGVDYAVGTMVWTLFDYYGEPPSAGLTVSSTYGQFDLCGFPKPSAFWFRTQWLLGISDDKPDKTFQTYDTAEVQIVQSWESPDTWNETRGNLTRIIHAYSNAPVVELLVNGKSQGSLPVSPMRQGGGSYAQWDAPWEAGTLSAIAYHSNGTEVARTLTVTNGDPTALLLSLDCPSEATGTGHSLILDGQDVALVRAAIVDSSGRTVHMASHNISFSVISGPGMIQGTSSGNPKSYEANNAAWHRAYHGLTRAVIRVTSVSAFTNFEKSLLERIDGDGWSAMSTSTGFPSLYDSDDIVVEASSPGLGSAILHIPTSTDRSKASVLATAALAAGKSVDFFSHDHPAVSPDWSAPELQ